MTYPTHNTAPINSPIPWCLSRSAFNGKEKDSESGFHYYGARYYWSEVMTGWLSVDPMADKYPNISPYAYCVWNPVKLVDPDGEEPWYRLITGYKYDKNNLPNPPSSAREHPIYGTIKAHHGMDIAFAKGGEVNAAASGTVLFAGVKNGYGNTVVIDHGGGYYSLYAHLNSYSVSVGDVIQNGAPLGEVGNTGIGTGPHLHVEYIKTDNTSNIFGGNKSSSRFNPMDVNDLQNIIDGKECQFVNFLDNHSEYIGSFCNIDNRQAFFNAMPDPKVSERLQENRLPIVRTLGDILKIVGL